MPEDRMLPNAALRTLFEAIEEVMGANGTKAVLKAGGLSRFMDNYPPNNTEMGVSFNDYGATEQAVEDFYGRRGARAMLVRIGRATFQYTLKEQPAILGLAGIALKALPMGMRMKVVLDRVSKLPTRTSTSRPTCARNLMPTTSWWRNAPADGDLNTTIRLVSSPSVCCRKPSAWATGKNFRIEEVACIAHGASACVYRIPKQPIE